MVHYLVHHVDADNLIRSFNYEIFSLEDCCAAISQFALLSLAVDAAILCPTAAAELVAKDSRFWEVGPVLANSVVIVTRDPEKVRKVGIAQHREYQVSIARKAFGEGVEILPISPMALGVAYESGQVDAAIVDIEDSTNLTGHKIQVGGFLEYVETYVLVVRQNIPDLGWLLSAFTAAAIELNNTKTLQSAIDGYSRVTTTGNEADIWKQQSGIVFLPIVASCNCDPR
ncbi:hypothetical protein C6366_16850 [Desulfonatronum sp. SC1]|nr:hypothetical protein C6366_16850 [Desulfonatronum sp. SC1]